LAADLAAGKDGLGVWRDAGGGPAVVDAVVRTSATQTTRRLAVSSAALHSVAAQPMLVRPHLAPLLGTDTRQARRPIATPQGQGLVRDEADGIHSTQAGMGLLAAAGLPTTDCRRLAARAGGRLPRPGGRRGTPTWGCWPTIGDTRGA